MSEILAITNQKGGVGKTTTAINLAAALAYLGQETLLVDLDPQGNATSGLGVNKDDLENGTYQVLLEDVPLEKAIRQTPVEMLDILGSTADMISAEVQLAGTVSRETRLKHALETARRMYSFIIIDCPPSLGLLNINALAAADRALVPIQGEYYSLEGLARLVDAIHKIREALNPVLRLEGGVLTMFDPRMTLAQQVKTEIERFFGQDMFKTTVSRSVRLAEAPSFGKTIFQYDPRSKGSENYLALAGELLLRRGWRGMKL